MSDNKKLLVVIDPGHTGNTYNAGAVKGYYESKAVYDLSLYEKAALEKRGIDAILTRERNQDPGLYERNHTDAFKWKSLRCDGGSFGTSSGIRKTGRENDRCHCQSHEAIHRHYL